MNRDSDLLRRLDLWLGAPVLWCLGLRPARPRPLHPRRIGIMSFEAIGDTLLASTLTRSLRGAHPDAEIFVFASRGNLGALALLDGIDRIVEVPITRPRQAVARMRSVPLDVLIDIGQWPRWYAFLAAVADARFTVGFRTRGQFRHWAYDAVVEHRGDIHEVENFRRLLAPLGGPAAVPPGLRPDCADAAPLELPGRRPYVVLHPWAGGYRSGWREWPAGNWVALIEWLDRAGFDAVISGAPSDASRAAALCEAGARSGVRACSLAGRASLAQLAHVLSRAAAAVAVNTGVMHLAALLGVPLVALHGPTDRKRWGPLGEGCIALAPPPGSEAEYLNLGFEYSRAPQDCMSRIGVADVREALAGLLNGASRADRGGFRPAPDALVPTGTRSDEAPC